MRYAIDYKDIACDSLRGKWPLAIFTGLVASLIGGTTISSSTSSVLTLDEDWISNMLVKFEGNQFYSEILSCLGIVSTVLIAFSIVRFIIGGAAQLGYAKFYLKLVDEEEASFFNLFTQFRRIGDGICMILLRALYVLLWSMLFIIPGIIKSYSYAMTPYILAENPEMTANDAITKSRRIMQENKWRLFCLDFSFIGWEMLCLLPVISGMILVNTTATNGGPISALWWLVPCAVLSFIGQLFLNPYIEAAHAAFYRDISE